MKLRSARPLDGARWMLSGVQLLFKAPLAHLACASLVSLALGLLLSLPWIGAVGALTLLPALSAGWVRCSAAPAQGLKPSPLLLLAPLRSPRRGALLRLGLAYAACALLMLWLAESLDRDFATHWARMTAGTLEANQVAEAVAQVQQGALLRGLLFVPVALLFWHAPVVVEREHKGVAQALFTSAIATLRNLTAFAVYGLCWLLADVLLSSAAGLVLGLLGLGSGALMLAMPLALLFMAAFYASLGASVAGCIEFDEPAGGTAPGA